MAYGSALSLRSRRIVWTIGLAASFLDNRSSGLVCRYWRCNKHADPAVFDLFFRKCPFDGQFTVFAGLEQVRVPPLVRPTISHTRVTLVQVLAFLDSYCFEAAQIEYLRGVLGQKCDARFFDWLAQVNCKGVKVYAQQEGNFCFPKQPLLRVEGPLAICQLLETTLLNMVLL